MEFEQILKRVEWMDDQRRKDQGSIEALEERLMILEGGLGAVNQQIQDLNGEMTRISAQLSRVDRFDTDLAQSRVEASRSIEEIEKRRTEREREIEETFRVQVASLNSHITEIRHRLEPIPKLENSIQVRADEDFRLGRSIDELKQSIREVRREDEDNIRNLRLLQEGRRRDEKRLTDLQGEVVTLRKRIDEYRGQLELTSDNYRKLDNRLVEVATVQQERQESYTSFVEQQVQKEFERDRTWKEWETRFQTVEKQAVDLDTQLQRLQETHRNVKQARDALEAITERMERRINEITEMQRLAEERFRQEWVTFKADDQKRWTNYTLTQEEQRRESARQLERLNEGITAFEDRLQEIQDILHQSNEQTEKRLQTLLATARDWVAEYERALGRAR